ncbi:hypothetical protein [Streptomyces sp. NPDC050416]|uniref:hypothetical protein n=1 Tax=Streptomyces sp. NPDC050416 TaxID=3365611 RepID=UPI0037A9715A
MRWGAVLGIGSGAAGRDDRVLQEESGGGGGTGVAPADPTVKVGYRDIKMKGVTYKCTATGD